MVDYQRLLARCVRGVLEPVLHKPFEDGKWIVEAESLSIPKVGELACLLEEICQLIFLSVAFNFWFHQNSGSWVTRRKEAQ